MRHRRIANHTPTLASGFTDHPQRPTSYDYKPHRTQRTMLEFPPPPPGVKPSDYLPRCRQCSYVLLGLDQPRCPECGTEFEPRAPSTYIRRVPFRPWTYWLPPFAVAFATAAIIVSLGATNRATAIGVLASVPLMFGILIGYSRNWTTWLTPLMLVNILALSIGVSVSNPHTELISFWNAIGATLTLSSLGSYLVWFGALIGSVLRIVLKRHNFSQSDWLP